MKCNVRLEFIQIINPQIINPQILLAKRTHLHGTRRVKFVYMTIPFLAGLEQPVRLATVEDAYVWDNVVEDMPRPFVFVFAIDQDVAVTIWTFERVSGC